MTKDTQPNNSVPHGGSTQPQVKRSSIDRYESIVDRAHKEIEGVRTVYKWLLAIFVPAITIIVVFGMYFSYQSVKDFKAEIQAKGKELKDELAQESKALSARLQEKLKEDVNALSRKVEDRVDKEFQKENIHRIVEDKAKSRVEEIADPLIQEHITKSIEPQIRRVEQQIEGIKPEIEKANTIISELKVVSEFTTTIIAAENDDRPAFDRLRSWADDNKFPRRKEAEQAWIKIVKEHASPITMSGYKVPWAEGVDPSQLSFENLKKNFASAHSLIRLGLIEYIWGREDFPKSQRMAFIVEIIKSDQSLAVVERAGRIFIAESKQNLLPLAVKQILDWWEKNKGDYEKAQEKISSDKK